MAALCVKADEVAGVPAMVRSVLIQVKPLTVRREKRLTGFLVETNRSWRCVRQIEESMFKHIRHGLRTSKREMCRGRAIPEAMGFCGSGSMS